MLEFLKENWLLLMIAIVLAIIWFLNMINRNMKNGFEEAKKQAEDVERRLNVNVVVGTPVTLDSGIHGIIKEIKKETYMVEIASKVVIEVEKYGVIFVR